jgi:hypothetical protein
VARRVWTNREDDSIIIAWGTCGNKRPVSITSTPKKTELRLRFSSTVMSMSVVIRRCRMSRHFMSNEKKLREQCAFYRYDL